MTLKQVLVSTAMCGIRTKELCNFREKDRGGIGEDFPIERVSELSIKDGQGFTYGKDKAGHSRSRNVKGYEAMRVTNLTGKWGGVWCG